MAWYFWLLIAIVAVVVLGVVMRIVFRSMHHAVLLAKFGDDATAEKIIDGKIWQGMTAAQLMIAIAPVTPTTSSVSAACARAEAVASGNSPPAA